MKVMLDECITRGCARTVISWLELAGVEGHFLIDFMGGPGALDIEWTLRCTPPEAWMVVTLDCGRAGPKVYAKGPPLQLILPSRKMTAFFLGGKKLHHASGAERAQVIIANLPEMLRLAASAPAGTRFKLKASGAGFKVEKWPMRPRQHPEP